MHKWIQARMADYRTWGCMDSESNGQLPAQEGAYCIWAASRQHGEGTLGGASELDWVRSNGCPFRPVLSREDDHVVVQCRRGADDMMALHCMSARRTHKPAFGPLPPVRRLLLQVTIYARAYDAVARLGADGIFLREKQNATARRPDGDVAHNSLRARASLSGERYFVASLCSLSLPSLFSKP